MKKLLLGLLLVGQTAFAAEADLKLLQALEGIVGSQSFLLQIQVAAKDVSCTLNYDIPKCQMTSDVESDSGLPNEVVELTDENAEVILESILAIEPARLQCADKNKCALSTARIFCATNIESPFGAPALSEADRTKCTFQ